ncbi:hypothetical protein HV314_23505 [Citrobacter sp. RHBSTW-00887]|nr:hypothetical protein HV314_23505 [Citrobacter sp. RHBSTW-00887]
MFGVIRQEDGRYPPLGVTIVDITSGKDVGLVADEGYAYLSGLQEDSKLRLQWGDNTCEITPPDESNTGGQVLILPCKKVN